MKTTHAVGRQRGMTLIGFVVVLSLVGFFAYIGMKIVPMYMEYYSVKQALKGLTNEPDIGNQDPARIKDLFFRRLYMSYSQNVKREDFKLERISTGGWHATVNYELRKPLVANLDVVGRFDAAQNLVNSAPAQ